MSTTEYVRRPKFYQPKTLTVIPIEQAQTVGRAQDVATVLSERFAAHGGPEQALVLLKAMTCGPMIGHLPLTLPAFEDAALVLAGALQDSHPLWGRTFEALSDLSESAITHEQDPIAALNQAAYLFLDLSRIVDAPEIWAGCHRILSRQIQTETLAVVAPIEPRIVFKRDPVQAGACA
jgi:hypothetical protein